MAGRKARRAQEETEGDTGSGPDARKTLDLPFTYMQSKRPEKLGGRARPPPGARLTATCGQPGDPSVISRSRSAKRSRGAENPRPGLSSLPFAASPCESSLLHAAARPPWSPAAGPASHQVQPETTALQEPNALTPAPRPSSCSSRPADTAFPTATTDRHEGTPARVRLRCVH